MPFTEYLRRWHVPLSRHDTLLGEAVEEIQKHGAAQEDIPWIVQIVENPKWDIPGVDIFKGATDLETHDYIHVILARGLLPKDEAFVLGFTMGATNRLSTLDETIYGLFSRYFYPEPYRFSHEDFDVYRDAVRLGFVSDCLSLCSANYGDLCNMTVGDARDALGIEEDLLRAYYAIEKRRYPGSAESQRLLD